MNKQFIIYKWIAAWLLVGQYTLLFAQKPAYKYTITIKNTIDTVCYLGYPYGDKRYIQDTATIQDNDTFVFRGVRPTGGIYFIYTPNNIYFDIVVNEHIIKIETDVANLVGNMKVIESEENRIFHEFETFMRVKREEAKELSEKLKNDKDGPEADSIREKLKDLDKEVKQYRHNLAKEYPDTFIAKFIMSTVDVEIPDPPAGMDDQEKQLYRYNFYKIHFFDNIDFSDDRMLRTPVFHKKIMTYLEKMTPQHPDSLIKSAHYIIDKSKANKDVFRYCLVTISNKYETSNIMGMDAVFVDLAENYYMKGDAFWTDADLDKKIRDRVKELKPTLLGKHAPNMSLLDTLLQPITLNGIKSDYIILYFYDPDCGHCKKKSPVLRDLYNESFKKMGVEVFAVCTVTDTKKWKKFIKDNKLNWLNAADPYLHDNFRANYNLNTTPKIFIVDKDKKIIAKRLDVEQLEDFIKRQIEMKKKS